MRKFCLLTISIVLLYSCNDNPVTPEKVNLYFPIQMGNSWNFELTYYDSELKHMEVTYTINKKKTINNNEYFSFNNWPEFIYFPLAHYFNMDSVFIRNDENGNVVMRADGEDFLFIMFDSSLVGSENNILELFEKNTQQKSIWESVIVDTNQFLKTTHEELHNGFKIMFLEFNTVGSQRDIVFFPGFGMVRMGYISYSMDWKLKNAIINGRKVENIITYPYF